MYYMEWDRRTASAGTASKCSNPDMAVQEGIEATGEVLRCHPGITLTDVTKVSVRRWLGTPKRSRADVRARRAISPSCQRVSA